MASRRVAALAAQLQEINHQIFIGIGRHLCLRQDMARVHSPAWLLVVLVLTPQNSVASGQASTYVKDHFHMVPYPMNPAGALFIPIITPTMVSKRLSMARVKVYPQRQHVPDVVASSRTYLLVLTKAVKFPNRLRPPILHHLALTVKLIRGLPASSRKTTALTRLATTTTTFTMLARTAPSARLGELLLKTSSATIDTPLPLIKNAATQATTVTITPTPTTTRHLPESTLLSSSLPHPLLIHGARNAAASTRTVSPRFRDRCTYRNPSSRSRSLLLARLQVRPYCLVSLHSTLQRGQSF